MGKRGKRMSCRAPQSDSQRWSARDKKREAYCVLTSELNIPLVRMPNLSAASNYARGYSKQSEASAVTLMTRYIVQFKFLDI